MIYFLRKKAQKGNLQKILPFCKFYKKKNLVKLDQKYCAWRVESVVGCHRSLTDKQNIVLLSLSKV